MAVWQFELQPVAAHEAVIEGTPPLSCRAPQRLDVGPRARGVERSDTDSRSASTERMAGIIQLAFVNEAGRREVMACQSAQEHDVANIPGER